MTVTAAKSMNKLCVGIDLGTTNSALSIANVRPNGDIVSKEVEIARAADVYTGSGNSVKLSSEKRPTLPSFVYYAEEKNFAPIVGNFAKKQYPLRPHLVAKSIKSSMGKPLAEGLSADIPDKTPAEISSRILQHLLKETGKMYHCEIKDAIITVPASFDSAMCKATRDAAELAGIKVFNDDGSERPVLLSEPNAVIYDFINQVKNGEIPNILLDLSTPKKVLVFDLGGGTLDITMHDIQRRPDYNEILKINEIATNRYTLLGGDDFDQAIAEVMFEHYLAQYSKYPDAVNTIKKEIKSIMPTLRVYAEGLKLDVSTSVENSGFDDSWGDENEDSFDVGGNMGIGYSYDDSFTKEQVENILEKFMGRNIQYFDYKRLEAIKDTNNIIYPILDVLNKAAAKLNVEDVKVDAVIMNGGMSKFYMITDRLREFFGFEPICALNPDLSVAKGAAVYHYYLNNFEIMKDDMRMVGADKAKTQPELKEEKEQKTVSEPIKKLSPIEWGNSILNDALYLGLKNGSVYKLIETGESLPYKSDIKHGFKVEAGQQMIFYPIRSRNIDGSYRTIGKGKIILEKKYNNGAYMSFYVYMSKSKVITLHAWTSSDPEGKDRIEDCNTSIIIGDIAENSYTKKLLPPSGSELNAVDEINSLVSRISSFGKVSRKTEKQNISKKIASAISIICQASNKKDFAKPILEVLNKNSNDDVRDRFYSISRRIGKDWNEQEKGMLASSCIEQLHSALNGYSGYGKTVSVNQQAIMTLSMCATDKQMNRLISLHDNPKYKQSLLYAHAKTKTCLEWLISEFEKDIQTVNRGFRSGIQQTAYAIGLALMKEGGSSPIGSEREEQIVKSLCAAIDTGNIDEAGISTSLLAIGFICDRRIDTTTISRECLQRAFDTIGNFEYRYSSLIASRYLKTKEIVLKLMQGITLSEDEEQYLLTKIEI